MPDQLVELYEQVALRVAELDSDLKSLLASCADADRAGRVKAQWEDLTALVRKQKEMLGDIGRRTRELASLSAFLQTHYEQEKARLARQLHDELGGILTPAKMDLSWRAWAATRSIASAWRAWRPSSTRASTSSAA
jgi:signal transduction histidine kinase